MNQFQVRFYAFKFNRRQSGKETILVGLMWRRAWHPLQKFFYKKSKRSVGMVE
jgi:hypothetical protein